MSKVWKVFNGWECGTAIFAIVIATTMDEAIEHAREAFKAKSTHYGPDYYERLEPERNLSYGCGNGSGNYKHENNNHYDFRSRFMRRIQSGQIF